MALRTTWDNALEFVLRAEGGFVEHANDRGGATSHGITLATLRGMGTAGDLDGDGDVDRDDVLEVTPSIAAAIYEGTYWRPSGAAATAEFAPRLAIVLFDMAVNHGVSRAVKLLQRVVGAQVDGMWGKYTKANLQLALARYGEGGVIQRLNGLRAAFYDDIVRNDASQAVFLRGWRNRIVELARNVSVQPPVFT